MNYGRKINELRLELHDLENKQSKMPFFTYHVSWPCSEWPPTCPSCSGELVGKHGKYGRFYGCRKFPLCHGSRNLDGSDGRDFIHGRCRFMDDDPDGKYVGIHGDYDMDDNSYPPSGLNGDY